MMALENASEDSTSNSLTLKLYALFMKDPRSWKSFFFRFNIFFTHSSDSHNCLLSMTVAHLTQLFTEFFSHM